MGNVPSPFRSFPFRRWLVAAVLGRLTAAMAPIALLAVGSLVYGSTALGARLAAVASVAAAVVAPWQGRRLDRKGTARGLEVALWQSAAVGLVMAAAVEMEMGSPWIEVVGGGLGAVMAVVPAGFRALLSQVVDGAALARASNVDAAGFEIALVGAPAVVAIVAATGPPSLIFVVGSALAGLAALLVPSATGERRRTSARWAAPSGVVMVAGALGVGGGLLEPAVFARADQLGRSESYAAALLAVIAVGSIAGGIAASLRPPPVATPTAVGLLAFHGAAVLVAASVGSPWMLAAWMGLAGVPIAPLTALGATLVDRRVATSQRAAAFAVIGAAMTLGTGVGQALAGWMIAAGATGSVLAASAAVGLLTAGGVGVVGRRDPASPAAGRAS